MQIIKKYFPDLSESQLRRFEQMPALYEEWNARINVISRQDLPNLEERHILHSLAICKQISFPDNSEVLDLGTGGGFPGIPLAVYFPSVQFHLVDGIKKKITVVDAVSSELGLSNVAAEQLRVEHLERQYDYVVCRAVAESALLWKYSKRFLKPEGILVCLKGGLVAEELKALPPELQTKVIPLSDFYSEDFFQEKSLVLISRQSV